MKTVIKFFLPFLILLLLLFTCKPPEPTAGPNPRTITISGSISSIDGSSSVANAEVRIKDAQALSGADGSFTITAFNVTDSNSFKITCPGYVMYQKSLSNYPGSNLQVDVALKPVDMTVEIDPARAEGNRISTPDKVSVFIPQLAGVTGPLIVSLTNYDVGTEEIGCAPGDFSTAGNETLVSQGMIDVSVTRKDTGAPVDLRGMGGYEITIPITGDVNAAPDTIPLWYFDAGLCKWVEEGVAQRSAADPGVYVGTVSHFTPWNCDMRVPPINVYWQIDDPSSEDDTYESRLTVNGGYAATVFGNEKEFYMPMVPQSMFIKMTVRKMSTGVTWTRYFYSYNASGCINLGVFPGPGDLPEVVGLNAAVDGHNVTVAWTDEPAGVAGAAIEYYPLGSTTVSTVTVPAGVMEQTLTGLNPGPYVLIVKTFDADWNQSTGLSRKVRVGDSFFVTITENPGYPPILYKYNDANVFSVWPGLEAVIPRKTKICVDIDSEYKGGFHWECNGTSYYDFPQEFTVEDDLTISLHDACS